VTGRRGRCVVALALAGVLGGCGGGGSGGTSKDGVPAGRSVNRTVSFRDHYGQVTVTVASAGVSETVFKEIDGTPDRARRGAFVFVTFSRFQLPAVESVDEMLELKGGDGNLYTSRLSDGPDSGGALVGDVDPNHFTEAFDLPKGATKGAVLIVHANGNGRDAEQSDLIVRRPPPGYEVGAHVIDLGLGG
jgi:hypothetical protein